MKSIFNLSCASLLFLTACQSIYDTPSPVAPAVQIPATDPQWQQQLAHLDQIKGYTAQGQFGYISPAERFSAHFVWQFQSAQQFSLQLSSPLSTKSLKLQRHLHGITLSDSEGRTQTEQHTTQLMQKTLGFAFPVDQLAYWLKGHPAQTTNYIVNQKRQLTQLTEHLDGVNWQVNFIEYHEDKLPHLPKLIVLENGQQQIKIRMDRWSY